MNKVLMLRRLQEHSEQILMHSQDVNCLVSGQLNGGAVVLRDHELEREVNYSLRKMDQSLKIIKKLKWR